VVTPGSLRAPCAPIPSWLAFVEHLPQIEDPQGMADAIDRWLERGA
jgi:hypothetical protein